MTRRLLPALALSIFVALPSAAAARPAPLHPAPGDAPSSFKGVPGALAKKSSKKKKRKSDPKAPVVTKVSPRKAKVGDVLVVTGKNFVKGTGKNRVAFYTRSGGAAFARDTGASARRLKVRVPDTLNKLLPATGADSRIVLRVRGRRLGKRSASRVSPLISIKAPTGPGGSGAACPNFGNPAADTDKDLLSDVRERDLGLNPCKNDSDNDRVTDGYEYHSAQQLNVYPGTEELPYPWKRPYPNGLFADSDTDYDGDGLTLWDEFRLWSKFGGSRLPMNYSDGRQKTAPSAAPSLAGLQWFVDMDRDGVLSDDERDADGDGLTNWDEEHGRMIPEWWVAMYNGEGGQPEETRYPITYAKPDFLDKDTDGDGRADGADDQDFDGLPNSFEIARRADWKDTYISVGPGTFRHNWNGVAVVDPDLNTPENEARFYARVQPFNPCKPVYSETCHKHPDFGYYADGEDWVGHPNPPARGPFPWSS